MNRYSQQGKVPKRREKTRAKLFSCFITNCCGLIDERNYYCFLEFLRIKKSRKSLHKSLLLFGNSCVILVYLRIANDVITNEIRRVATDHGMSTTNN